MQLPLTMQLSPDVCTLKVWISPWDQTNKLSPFGQGSRNFTLTPKVRQKTTFSPPCWQGTRQGNSPCLDAPPGNMPWSACVPKSFQVQNKSICKGQISTAYEGAYTKTMHEEAHKNISIQIMSKHLSFVKEKHHHKGPSILEGKQAC
jgi:hypothetical protein